MARFDPLVLIRGAGALGSGAAYRLVKAGFPVAMTELASPLSIFGTVSYGMAIYYHTVVVEGIVARNATVEQVPDLLAQHIIPVIADPGGHSIAALQPAVVIDARGTAAHDDTARDTAELVVGLGSAFSAGTNCHAVVETGRGHNLGRVIWQGGAQDVDIEIGHVLYSPVDGLTLQVAMIGEYVRAGALITRIGEVSVHAPVDGVVCGLLDNDIQVGTGSIIGLIDPQARREHCFTISAQALAVGGGVVEAVLSAPQFANVVNPANILAELS